MFVCVYEKETKMLMVIISEWREFSLIYSLNGLQFLKIRSCASLYFSQVFFCIKEPQVIKAFSPQVD